MARLKGQGIVQEGNGYRFGGPGKWGWDKQNRLTWTTAKYLLKPSLGLPSGITSL